MIIEDQEIFKTWLTKVLEPLCDADPAALAKYVFALVKKDKPIPELRASMVEQLDVFLQQETKSFVDRLFTTLENKNYHIVKGDPEFAKTTVESEEINSSSSPKQSTISEMTHEDTPISSTISNGAVSTAINESPIVTTSASKSPRTYEHVSNSSGSVPYIGTSPSPERTVAGGSTSARSNTVPPTGTGSGRDSSRSRSRSPAYNPRTNRTGARSRSKSRSRSWERGERVPRRDRRDRSTRAWRNKSPPSRRHERRRSWSRNRASRSRSRSPRYPTHRGRYRNRSPPQNRPNQTSNAIRTTSRVQSTGTPTQDSNHGDVDMRLNTTSQSIHSLIGKENVTASELSSGTSSANAITFPKRRCNDFDEKGYCMRGDLCPYDHGNDPVVLEDIALSRVLTFGPGAAGPAAAAPGATPGNTTGTTTVTGATVATTGPVVSPRVPPQTTVGSSSSLVGLEASVQPPPSGTSLHQIQGSVHNAPPSINARPFISTMEYNPDEPSIAPRMTWTRNTYRTSMNSGHRDLRNSRAGPGLQGNINGIPTYTPQRELINVPMSIEHNFTHTPTFKKRRAEDGINDMNMKKKTAFDFNRLGPRSKNTHNCCLELKKVPRGLNTIEHLNNHFAKFGKIVKVQITYEGDPEAAIITFSSHAEANTAYRSTEAVLNNRFIKVFWHNPTETKDNTTSNNMTLTTQSTISSLNSVAPNTAVTTSNTISSPARLSVKERLGFPAKSTLVNPHRLVNHPPNASDQEKTQPNFNLTKTVYIPTAMRKPEASSTPTSPVAVHANTPDSIQQTQPESDAAKKASELFAAKKLLKIKHQEKRQEALKLTVNLRKRKQDLLDKQLQQQRELLSRLEKTTNQEQRDDILGTLRALQDNIQLIKKDLTDVVNTMSTQVKQNKPTTIVKRTREEAQKELLDAELDLINKQQEGEDTTEIQRRIAQLKAETRGSSITNSGPSKSANTYNRFSSGRHVTNRTLMRNASNSAHGATSLYRTNGGSRNSRINSTGTAPNTFPHSTVDHRPTHILISGYEADDKDQVLEHFSQFGQVTEISVDEFTPSVVLGYSTRKEAEVAVTKGRTFQDRLLSVTWSHGNSSSVSSSSLGTNSSPSVVPVGVTANASSASLPQNLARTVQNRYIKGGLALSQIKNDDTKIDDNQVDEEEILENIDEPKHELLGDEDEEDEDGEVRSWRR